MAGILNGDYYVYFESNLGTSGYGTVFLRNGKITGGDGSFRYVGFVVTAGGCYRGRIAVECMVPGALSLFGKVDRFELDFSGIAERDRFALSGQVRGAEHLRIRVKLIPAMRIAAE